MQLGLMACAGINQTAGHYATKYMVQAGLVAANAGVNFVGAIFLGLEYKVRISQEGASHRNHICITASQHFLGHFWGIDTVGGNHRYRQLFSKAGCHPGKCRSWHLGGNSGDLRFMPTYTSVNNGGTSLFNSFAQLNHFLCGAATVD